MNTVPYIFMVTPAGRERSARLTMFASAIQRAWKLALLGDEPGWLALGDRDAPCIDLPDGGLIWGQLFANRSTRGITTPTESAPLVEPTEQFVGRYWGGYLAIRRVTGGIEVLRDPSGGIPCYTAEIDGTYVLTSQPHLLFDAGLLAIEIDWTIVAQSVAFRDIKPARTALCGVSELLPGVAAEIGPRGIATRCVWSPWDFARADLEIDDFSSATNELHEVTRHCIAAFAGRYQQAVVEISGGLDSAIVAAGLALAGNNPACINFWPAAGDPDERPYAQAIAEKLQLNLDEVPLRIDAVDLASSHAHNLPRASARTFAQAMDQTTRDVGMRVGADVFFGGSGGDCVFCHLQSALPVVDRFLREGLSPGLWRTIQAVAQLAPATVWEVTSSASRQFRRRFNRLPSPRRNRFLTADASNGLPWPAENPWLEAAQFALPGKRRHIWSLISIQNHMEGYSRLEDAPIISPLLAQPMLELCIRIPTWLWCTNGRNRAVARAAFADALPTAVIARRSKGGFDSFGAALIDANRPLLREMLLDGALSRQGLIETVAVRQALERPLPNGEVIVELLALVDQEAWIRAWQDRRVQH